VSIKEEVIDPALKSGDLATIERAAATWKALAEAEKLELDTKESAKKARSESARFWIPIFAPLLSAAALVATFLFQIQQAKATGEDTAWREALNRGRSTQGPEGTFFLTLMKGFFDSERYAKPAREISVNILGHMADPDAFKVLFPDVMRRTTWENVNDICRIGSFLNKAYQKIPPTDQAPKPDTVREMTSGKLSAKTLDTNFSQEIALTGRSLASFMRSHSPRPRNTRLELSDFQFGSVNLDGLDFSQANVHGAAFFRCTVNDGLFRGINDFEDSDWEGTPWWRAREIDPRLLDYLVDNFRLKPGAPYAGGPGSQVQYDEAVERLKKIAR
jgi:hypothetical protein